MLIDSNPVIVDDAGTGKGKSPPRLHPVPMVSVVLPVYNDIHRLNQALEALRQQTYPRHRYEVIVIDNDSDIDPKPSLKHFKGIVLAQEKQVGAFPARNTGIRLSRGEIIAFTDSDCIPAKDWIEKGVESLLKIKNCGLVAGQIDIYYANNANPTAIELYDHLTALPQEKFIQQQKFGATANLFVPKSVFRQLGLFSPEHKTEGGDAELGFKTFKAGMTQVYCPGAVVKHPARTTFKELIRKARRTTIGTCKTIEKYNYQRLNAAGYVAHHLVERPKALNAEMIAAPICASKSLRIKVIAIYFLIKFVQIFERIRSGAGNASPR